MLLSFLAFVFVLICIIELIFDLNIGMKPVTQATLERKFIETGERERMKELLISRLRETGWIDEVHIMCQKVVQSKVFVFSLRTRKLIINFGIGIWYKHKFSIN